VARVVPVISGETLRRVKAVEGGFAKPDASDETALRDEFNGMLAIA
jgi:beta-N-acetylhexosaminidase